MNVSRKTGSWMVGFLTWHPLLCNKRSLFLSQYLIPAQVYLAAWPPDSKNVET